MRDVLVDRIPELRAWVATLASDRGVCCITESDLARLVAICGKSRQGARAVLNLILERFGLRLRSAMFDRYGSEAKRRTPPKRGLPRGYAWRVPRVIFDETFEALGKK